MLGYWFLIAAVIALLFGLAQRRRIRRAASGKEPIVTDEVLRRVLEEGTVDLREEDEPLDEDRIRKAEEEFWSRDWEDPDPWEG